MTIYEFLKEKYNLPLMSQQIEEIRKVVLIDSGVCPDCLNSKVRIVDGQPVPCPRCF